MIKYQAQNAYIEKNENGTIVHYGPVLEFTYEGEEWEKTAYIAKVATGEEPRPSDNEKWFCPDSAKLYYWSVSDNGFREVGAGAVTSAPN